MDRARRLEADSDSKHVSEMMDFILGETIRNFLTPR